MKIDKEIMIEIFKKRDKNRPLLTFIGKIHSIINYLLFLGDIFAFIATF